MLNVVWSLNSGGLGVLTVLRQLRPRCLRRVVRRRGRLSGPGVGRIGKLGDERPVDDPELQARIELVLLISRIELVLLILVIFSMTAKPFLGT